jgi:hypothetical protein
MQHKDWMNYLDEIPETARLTRSILTEAELKLEAIWKCAFPEKLNHDEVLQLIYRLYTMDGDTYPTSMRSVAHDVGLLLGLSYIWMLGEVYGVDFIVPDEAYQSFLKERLESCGYYKWLLGEA